MTTAQTEMQADNARFAAAQADPIIGPIMSALFEQDARTYHGDSGDKVELATRVAEQVARAVRRDERQRLAALFDENFEAIGGTCKTPTAAVRLVALLLRMDHGDVPVVIAGGDS